MSLPLTQDYRLQEWQTRLLAAVSGLLVFETLTGLAIWLLPFSVTGQIMVLMHTGIGLVFAGPFVWYMLRHWRLYRAARMTHVKLTGYLALIASVAVCVSGLVLTYQALLATRISYGWDLVHILATLALLASALPHVVTLVIRNLGSTKPEIVRVRRAQRRLGLNTLMICGVLTALVALLAYAYEPIQLNNTLPDDYAFLYGEDRPFAPSLARTATNDAYDPRSLGGSESCGTSGCHEEIAAEWAVSAHRYSAMDPAFRAVQSTMGEQNGPESTRYCAGCHDPISLFAGTKNLFREDLTNPIGYDEGVSCIACHSIKETDVKGNANYVLEQPSKYMFELHDNGAGWFVRDFLIRAYPRHHVQSLQHTLFKSPEFCAACHKQFIDEEINQVGWVQLQNQYDNWRKSRWNHPDNAEQTIECRECHMPLAPSRDPASGDGMDYNRNASDGKHRSHRFLASNQFVPELLDLPGAAEHTKLTEQWLRGEYEVPEIADKWKSGPAVPLELVVPESVAPNQEVEITAVITNNKVGHDFPTGPLDIIQAWIEIEVQNESGEVVYSSGNRDERHFIEPGSFILKAEPVDRYGNLIDRHNLWEMVGVRYKRSLFPGFSDQAQFAFLCPASVDSLPPDSERTPSQESFSFPVPGHAAAELRVSARLLYRKFDQFLLNFLFGEESSVTAPITEISEATAVIKVQQGDR